MEQVSEHEIDGVTVRVTYSRGYYMNQLMEHMSAEQLPIKYPSRVRVIYLDTWQGIKPSPRDMARMFVESMAE